MFVVWKNVGGIEKGRAVIVIRSVNAVTKRDNWRYCSHFSPVYLQFLERSTPGRLHTHSYRIFSTAGITREPSNQSAAGQQASK